MAPAVQASHRGVGFGVNHWRQPAPLDGFFDVVSLWLHSTLVVDFVLALLARKPELALREYLDCQLSCPASLERIRMVPYIYG
jgi:hypothetical protein